MTRGLMDSGLHSQDLRRLGEVLQILANNGGGGIWIEYDPHSTGEFRFVLSIPLDASSEEGSTLESSLVTDFNLEFGLLAFIELAQDRVAEQFGAEDFPGVQVAGLPDDDDDFPVFK